MEVPNKLFYGASEFQKAYHRCFRTMERLLNLTKEIEGFNRFHSKYITACIVLFGGLGCSIMQTTLTQIEEVSSDKLPFMLPWLFYSTILFPVCSLFMILFFYFLFFYFFIYFFIFLFSLFIFGLFPLYSLNSCSDSFFLQQTDGLFVQRREQSNNLPECSTLQQAQTAPTEASLEQESQHITDSQTGSH